MNWLLKSFTYTLAISSSWLLFTNQALADIKLTTGTPTKEGVITIKITLGNGKTKIVNVTVPEETTSTGKAILINNAFKTGQPFTLKGIEQNGNMLTFPKIVDKFEKLKDTTGETTKLEAVNEQKAKKGQIDGEFIEIASQLAGVDALGNESIFIASLGFETETETILASSQFLFSELGGNDIDNWLSSIFTDLQGQLPVVYQPNLSLDLDNDLMSFIFPDEILPSSGLIENGTTDINASSSLDIEVQPTPEPTSTLSLLSLGILGAGATLKRKVKRSHSIKKEPTKVG